MTARSDMKHRALVEMPQSSGTDPDGHPNPPTWATKYEAMPCLYWTTQRNEQAGPDTFVVNEQIKLIAPINAALTEGDRVALITDRLGNELTDHVYNIRSVQYKVSHQECLLETVL